MEERLRIRPFYSYIVLRCLHNSALCAIDVKISIISLTVSVVDNKLSQKESDNCD